MTGDVSGRVCLFELGSDGASPTAKRRGRPSEAHSAPITAVAMSPDGKRLFTASEDFSIRVWEIDRPPSASGGEADTGGESRDDGLDLLLTLDAETAAWGISTECLPWNSHPTGCDSCRRAPTGG